MPILGSLRDQFQPAGSRPVRSGDGTSTPPRESGAIEPSLSAREVAAMCGVSVKAIRRAIERGELVAYKLSNRIRIDQRDYESWVAQNRIKTESQPITTRLPGAASTGTSLVGRSGEGEGRERASNRKR